MIDLADAYRRMQEILDGRGMSQEAYCLSVSVWNYRHGRPSVSVTASSQPSGVMAYDQATIEVAVAEYERLLDERLAPPQVPPTDLMMTLPSADGGVVEQAAAAGAEDLPF